MIFTNYTIFKFKFGFILCVWELCLRVSLSIMCMPGACGAQEREVDPLELELRIDVKHHVGCGCWGLNPGSLEDQPVFLTTNLSLQSRTAYFLKSLYMTSGSLSVYD